MKPTTLFSQAGWKWYGFAGHHICSARCQYHLCTSINGAYLVSTVGRFVPDPLRAPGQTSTVGSERDYETFVFLMNGDDENGDPVIPSRDVVDSCGYTDSMQAEAGHYAMCEKWARVGGVPTKCDGNHGGPRCADPECWNDSPDAPPETIETAIQARKAAQEQLYAARERHADEVKRLQAENGRLQATQQATPEPTINWHGTHFTYQNQPSDNVTCWRLGEAARSAKPGGDLIDHGLSLLQQLQKQGFGVFSLAAKTQPATTEPGPTTRAEAEESDWRNRLTVNLLRQGAGLTKTQIRALISYAVDGVEPDPALFDTTERKGEPVAWMLPREGDECALFREPQDYPFADKGWFPLYTSPQVPEDVMRAKAINAVMAAAALLSPLVEDGKAIRVDEARAVLRHLRETRAAIDAARKEGA